MTRERRQSYSGPVEVWIDGAKKMDANVRLTGYVDVSIIRTLGEPDEPFPGRTSWDGNFVGMSEQEVATLFGQQLELRFKSGRVGDAFLHDTTGFLQGSGETPFD